MRLTTLWGRTLREAPADAEGIGYQLALRAALVRPLQAGSFAMLPLGMRALRKIEAIMHDEMSAINGQEFRTPVVQSVGPWEQTGRSAMYGDLILRAIDRNDRNLIVAPTHEEAVAEISRRETTSYRQMPQIIYQIHTKYRDEIRTKGGMMRMREFTMLDAYSLDADDTSLDATYEVIAGAFERVFERCGIRFVAVEASAGEMGGRAPREYMALSESGEDTLVLCEQCNYAANLEVAVSGKDTAANRVNDDTPLESVATPNCATIADVAAFFGVPESQTAKAVFFYTPERGLVFAVIRGDKDVNETKLRAAIGGGSLAPATAEQISAAGAVPGYASPVGLRVATTAAATDGVLVVADPSVVDAGALVAGANQAGYHVRNAVYGRDWTTTVVADIATVQPGDPCAECGAPLRYERGVEIGHIFKLGSRYAEALGATFLDRNGVAKPLVMGSYGIGLERLLQLVLEQHHDDAGIIWPASVAPMEVHLVRIGKKPELHAAADEVYTNLRAAGVDVLYDDRDESPGVKFNDADLLGLPLRVLVSERLLKDNLAELKPRGGTASTVALQDVVQSVRNLVA